MENTKQKELYDETGKINEEFFEQLKDEENKTDKESVKLVMPKEKMANKKFKLNKTGKRIIAGALAVLFIGGAAYLIYRNTKKSSKNTEIVQTEEQYSRELLEQRIKSFTEKANANGINLTEEEVKNLSSVVNMDRIITEDSELAHELFYGKNAQEIISNAGHTIGVLMTNSYKNQFKNPMNLSSLVVGSDYDKAIMQKLENYRDELTTMRDEEPGMQRANFETPKEEKKFEDIITDVLNFYTMTSDGLEIDGENAVVQKMSDGSRFSMVLVMNEIALGNNNLLSKEQKGLFEASMTNEPILTNLHRLIEGCQTQELDTQKVKTK